MCVFRETRVVLLLRLGLDLDTKLVLLRLGANGIDWSVRLVGR